ncbi:damage-control phosphatase ARMT1 family protein [Nocardiopsis sp. YSL2]|uniref:damage-control phosphatase ARMT1 family protein n=1 Tax=Nocardiopsis sp. YSL2 TaxID=2939492 RepID=UPI0026F45403|nr:damage-control phosphatase ARMT1 family protein [Nocardiopsis sp. YSL2]
MPEGSRRAVPTELPRADVVTGDVPGSFPRSVMCERHPALIDRVSGAFPYPPEQRARLSALREEATEGVIEPLDEDAHDHGAWRAWGMDDHVGTPWTRAPFLWAESYFYRRLLGALDYFGPGPWQGVDPFAPFKRAELAGPEAAAEIGALDSLADLAPRDRDQALLRSSLWGNRADLGFQVGGGDTAAAASGLVADHSAELWELLETRAGGRVCLVADNAGRELLPDLVLIDTLLATDRAREVVLHVKPGPYYVSDATMADVLDGLRRLCEAGGAAERIGTRLWRAVGHGRLRVRAHAFSCAPLPYRDMPADLAEEFAAASVTLMKGDLNYRRLVGDRHWPATTPFAAVTAYFPGPVAALRTLKSDVVTGLDRAAVQALDAGGGAWRTSGTHALVQLAGA